VVLDLPLYSHVVCAVLASVPTRLFAAVTCSCFGGQEDGGAVTYESSEIVIYKNFIISETGDVAAALKHLDDNEAKIRDKQYVLESRGAPTLAALHGPARRAVCAFLMTPRYLSPMRKTICNAWLLNAFPALARQFAGADLRP
jgi:hypothetical protein